MDRDDTLQGASGLSLKMADRVMRERRSVLLASLLVFIAVAIAYANCFRGTFVFDDRTSIVENESVRSLWPLSIPLTPPSDSGTGGRPFANLSFAVSHALGGGHPWGHHAVNLLLHVGSALVVFGVLRRTFRHAVSDEGARQASTPLAALTAAVWGVHPLHTQTVTYLSQRTELLMGLFYLLTLYCFIRSLQGRTFFWSVCAIVFCLLGALSKESIVTVPVVVLLFHRLWRGGTLVACIRERAWLYAGLGLNWLLVGWLLLGVRTRGVGYGLGLTAWENLLVQSKAVLTYLALSFWPHPLILDRGVVLNPQAGEYLPYVLGFLLVTSVVFVVARKLPVVGLAGAWFMLILAPTSSVVPVIQQPIAENRAYLPSVAMVAVVVLLLHRLCGRRAALVLSVSLALAGIVSTQARNRLYHSPISIWSDVVAKAPDNARAHYNLGVEFGRERRQAEAIASYREALRLAPQYDDALNNLGNLLKERGEFREAAVCFERLLQKNPDSMDVRLNLANVHLALGRIEEAERGYLRVLQAAPASIEAKIGMGNIRLGQGRAADAAALYIDSLKGASSNKAVVRSNLGVALFHLGRVEESLGQLRQAVRDDPGYAEAFHNLAIISSEAGLHAEALLHCEHALQLRPDYEAAKRTLEALKAFRDRKN